MPCWLTCSLHLLTETACLLQACATPPYASQFDSQAAVLCHCLQGDMMDVVLCSVSMMVFVYTAMQLYRLYAWSYYTAGFHTFAEMLN